MTLVVEESDTEKIFKNILKNGRKHPKFDERC